MRIQVTIERLSPLLMNRFTDEHAGDANTSTHSPSPASSPLELTSRAAYRDEKTGELYIPGLNIFSALVEAGSFHMLGTRSVTTRRSSLVPQSLRIVEFTIPLNTSSFAVDSRRVRNRRTRELEMCHRARVDSWKATFHLDIDETFPRDLARDLVDTAGNCVGLGDFRPSRSGPFGRFAVSQWQAAAGLGPAASKAGDRM